MTNQNGIVMEEVTDPTELVTARAQDERFDRNFRLFQSHGTEIFNTYRDKCIVIADKNYSQQTALLRHAPLRRLHTPKMTAGLFNTSQRKR